MGLICSLFGHDAAAASVRWNAGVCFGRCTRCASDIVRDSRGQWVMPRGFRVVWRPVAAAPAVEAAVGVSARETLFERLKGQADAMVAEREEAMPVEPEASAAPEWPLVTAEPVREEAEEPIAETPAEAAPVGPEPFDAEPVAGEPAEEAPRLGAPDFMDEGDEGDWDDFGGVGRRSALV